MSFSGISHKVRNLLIGWIDFEGCKPDCFTQWPKYLGYEMEQLDVLEGGYLPQAWGDAEEEQTALRQAILRLLAGVQPLKVAIEGRPTTAAPGSREQNLRSSIDGPYLVRYVGVANAAGYGTLFFEGGKLWGNDLAGGRYDGSYQIIDGRLRGTASLKVPAGVTLVTGFQPEADMTVPISFELPITFADRGLHPVSVGDQTVRVSFERIPQE